MSKVKDNKKDISSTAPSFPEITKEMVDNLVVVVGSDEDIKNESKGGDQ